MRDIIKGIVYEQLINGADFIGHSISEENAQKQAITIVDEILNKNTYLISELSEEKIKAIFSLGIRDHYGEVKKIYPKMVISWFEQQKRYDKTSTEKSKIYNELPDEEYRKNAEHWGPYTSWRLKFNIDNRDVNIEQYHEAVSNGFLKELEKKYSTPKKNNLF